MTSMATGTHSPFHLREAERMLPLLRSIADEMAGLQEALHEARSRPRVGEDPWAGVRAGNEARRRLGECREELKALGIHWAQTNPYIFHIPWRRGREVVWLCWRWGSPYIERWHTPEHRCKPQKVSSHNR